VSGSSCYYFAGLWWLFNLAGCFFTYTFLAAFVSAMARYGFEGLHPLDIVKTGKKIRETIGAEDPGAAAIL
jgi:hypothetical protein